MEPQPTNDSQNNERTSCTLKWMKPQSFFPSHTCVVTQGLLLSLVGKTIFCGIVIVLYAPS